MKTIRLTKNKLAIVDDEDFERISKLKWHASTNGYANSRLYHDGKNIGLIGMHRYILNAPKNKHVDHIDGNTLNNTKNNLRLCAQVDNNKNMKTPITNKTGFKGVRKRKYSFTAQISINNKSVYLGSFKTAIEAAKVYNEAAIKYYGQFARINNI